MSKQNDGGSALPVKTLGEMMLLVKQNSVNREDAFKAGVDCAKNGANTTNCHFRFFGSRELTKFWEAGKNSVAEDAARAKEE
jgi:hypothetical protein